MRTCNTRRQNPGRWLRLWRSPIGMGDRSGLRPPLLSHSPKSGQFICYRSGQIYLLLTGSFSWRQQPYGWLHDSRVHALARDRRQSREFIVLAGNGPPQHPADWKIRLVMDDHSAHVSKETFKWLVVRVVSNLYSHLNTHRGSTWWKSFSARWPPFISAEYPRAFQRRTD